MDNTKLSSDHIELSEPAFFQLDRDLPLWNLLQKHRRALLICKTLGSSMLVPLTVTDEPLTLS